MTARRAVLVSGELEHHIQVLADGNVTVVRFGGGEIPVALQPLAPGVSLATCKGQSFVVHHAEDQGGLHLHIGGETYVFRLTQAEPRTAHVPAHHDLRAPMPGVVTKLFVEPGQVVESGDALFALEAMKMETVVRAAARARVARIHVSVGAQVEGGALVVEVDDLRDTDHNPEEENG